MPIKLKTTLAAYQQSSSFTNDYILPPANNEELGGVKIGEKLNITSDGVLSVDYTDKVEKDNQNLVTANAVYDYLSNTDSNSPAQNTQLKSYEVKDLTGSTWLRVAKLTDPTKMGSGILTLDTQAEKKIETPNVLDLDSNPTLKGGNNHKVTFKFNLQDYYNNISNGFSFTANGDHEILALKPNGDGTYNYIHDNKVLSTDRTSNYFFNVSSGVIVPTIDQKIPLFTEDVITAYLPCTLSKLLEGHFPKSLGKFTKISGTFEMTTGDINNPAGITLALGGEGILTITDSNTSNTCSFSITPGDHDDLNFTLNDNPQPILYLTLDLANCEFEFEEEIMIENDLEISSYATSIPTVAIDLQEIIVTYEVIPLTFSSFNVACGVNNKDQFISDVLPIAQAPEIGGKGGSEGSTPATTPSYNTSSVEEALIVEDDLQLTDLEEDSQLLVASADESELAEEIEVLVTSDYGSSLGSSASSSFGIAAVKFERYDNDTYVCALLNYPSTDILRTFYANLKIENNLNLELLENLEPVELDEVEYKGEGQLLEGMTFKANTPYEIKITGNLEAFKNAYELGGEENAFEIKFNDDYTLVNNYLKTEEGNRPVLIINNSDDCSHHLFSFEQLEYVGNGGCTIMNSLNRDLLAHFSPVNEIYTKLTKVSGTIKIQSLDEELQEILLNGTSIPFDYQMDERLGDFVNVATIPSFTKDDKIEIKPESLFGHWYIALDHANCEYEITIPFKKEEDFLVEKYTITNNDRYNVSVKQVEVIKHYATDGYDLYSPYNELERLNITIQSASSTANNAYNGIEQLRGRIESSCITTRTVDIDESFSGDIISETFRQILLTDEAAENEIIKVRDRLFCKYETRRISHPAPPVTLYHIYIDLHELATGITYKYQHSGSTSLPNTSEQPTYTTINDQKQRVFYAELTDSTITIQEFIDSLPILKIYDNTGSNSTKINGPIIVRHKDSYKLYNTYLFNFNCDIKNNVNNKNKVSLVNLSTGIMYETQDWNITFADLLGRGSDGNYYLDSDYVSYGHKLHIRGAVSSTKYLPKHDEYNYNRTGEVWIVDNKLYVWTQTDLGNCQWIELTGSSDYYDKSAIDNLLKNRTLAATADASNGSNTLDNCNFVFAMFIYCINNKVGFESSENTASGIIFNGRYLVSIKNIEENIYKMYVSDLREHKYYEYAGEDNTGLNTYPSLSSTVFNYKTEYSFQPKLTAGEGITIDENNTISTSGGASSDLARVINSQNMTDIPSDYIAGNTLLEYGYYPLAETIAEGAFKDCINLKELTINKEAKTIAWGALENCDNLVKLSIPKVGGGHINSLFMTDGDNEFYDIKVPASLKKVILTKNSTYFQNCPSIEEVVLPEGIKFLTGFMGCTGLKKINIPQSVTRIGDWTFRECSSLTNVELPEGLTQIGEASFSGGSSLTNIELPNTLESIGNSAFSKCAVLQKLTIPDNIISIGSSILSSCNNLKELTIPFIGEKAEEPTKGYLGYLFGASNYNVQNNSIPSTLKKVKLTKAISIPDYAFYNCTNLEDIILPSSLEFIGSNAFYGCSGIQEMELYAVDGNGLTISDNAFSSCQNLTGIILHNVVSLGDYIVYQCPNFELVSYEGTLEDWCSKITFSGPITNTTLKRLNLKTDDLNDSYDLTNLVIPESITKIKPYTFARMEGITNITIPNTVTSIDMRAFSNCDGFTTLTLPSSVSYLGWDAFAECSGLTAVMILGDLSENANSGQFSYCSNLERITFKGSLPYFYSKMFYNCSKLKDIYLGGTTLVNCRYTNAFTGCSGVNIHVKSELVDSYAADTNWSTLISSGQIVIVGDYVDEETTE